MKETDEEVKEANKYKVVELLTTEAILATGKDWRAESEGDFSLLENWSSGDVVLALHSVN